MGSFSQGVGGDSWGDPTWGGPSPDLPDPGFTLQSVLDRLYPRLHATNAADLTPWTEADLLNWMVEALNRLARMTGCWIRRVAINTTAAAADYALPTDHIATVHVTVDKRPLYDSTRDEAEALDPDFLTTPGPTERWYADGFSGLRIGLAKVPNASYEMILIERHRLELTPNAALYVAAPRLVSLYLEDYVLREAYSVPGDFFSPDIAALQASKVQWWEQNFQAAYGGWR